LCTRTVPTSTHQIRLQPRRWVPAWIWVHGLVSKLLPIFACSDLQHIGVRALDSLLAFRAFRAPHAHVLQVVPGTGQELTGGPVFDRWHACDTVTYAITFKNDRGESKRVVRLLPARGLGTVHEIILV
jgi:hypothetical protein